MAFADWSMPVIKQQIEIKVLGVIKSVQERKFTEDSWVEIKREWPADHAQTARHLAGQANAAQGEPILWIIGLDEKQGVKGAHKEELANWFPQIKKHFDSLCPELVHCLTVPTDGGPVVALMFKTDRAPYVINITGSDRREVPWRSANGTRSAFRSELLRLLFAVQAVPSFVALSGRMTATLLSGPGASGAMRFHVFLGLYAALEMGQSAVIPFHRCACWLEITGVLPPAPFDKVKLSPPIIQRGVLIGRAMVNAFSDPPEHDSLTIGGTDSEVIISGPGAVNLDAYINSVVPLRPPVREDAQIDLRLGLISVEREVNINVRLISQGEKDQQWTWLLASR